LSKKLYKKAAILFFALFILAASASCATKGAAQAEEYYSIGRAYFEMGKFAEAEMWLNRARAADKTMLASEYNLGRIAFETGHYTEAAGDFETILKKDPDNTMALKAAAYSRIKNGDFEKAEAHYTRVLELVPESADDGFNYALVLYGLQRYEDCERVLNKYPFALEEKAPSVLLLARAQREMGRIEAVDTFAKWIIVNAGTPNPQGFLEYARILEKGEFYARALEQYDDAIKAATKDTENLKKSTIRFEKSRLLLTVDPDNEDGLKEFNNAVNEGFSDIEAIEALTLDKRINQYHRDEIQKALDGIKIKLDNMKKEDDEKEEEETEEDETEASA
jgi:tetratricopeptide (TPR) repeat protein